MRSIRPPTSTESLVKPRIASGAEYEVSRPATCRASATSSSDSVRVL